MVKMDGCYRQTIGCLKRRYYFSARRNAVDAACAIACGYLYNVGCIKWGGETQALIYNPKQER